MTAASSRRFGARSALAVALLLGAACSRRPAELARPQWTREQERAILEHEIAKRRALLQLEIAELGPDHPWAGIYFACSDSSASTMIMLAPKAGCLAVGMGCTAMYAANWGSVEAHGSRLTLAFEREPTKEVSAKFDSEYAVEPEGISRRLRPQSFGRPLIRQFALRNQTR